MLRQDGKSILKRQRSDNKLKLFVENCIQSSSEEKKVANDQTILCKYTSSPCELYKILRFCRRDCPNSFFLKKSHNRKLVHRESEKQKNLRKFIKKWKNGRFGPF